MTPCFTSEPIIGLPKVSGKSGEAHFSWTAYLGGLGRPYWVLQVFSLQNALCWVVIGILLFRWFPKRDGRAFALWFACLFNGAVLGSTLGALLGLPSMLLIMLGVIALEEERRLLSGLIFGLAGLGRETNVLGAAAPAWPKGKTPRELMRSVGIGLIVVVPLLLWIVYVTWAMGSVPGAGNQNVALPLFGYAGKWKQLMGQLFDGDVNQFEFHTLCALIGLTVQGVYLVIRREWNDPWWRIGAAYVFLLSILGFSVWDGHPGAATRLMIPLAFAYNLRLRQERSRWFWPLALLGNLGTARFFQWLWYA